MQGFGSYNNQERPAPAFTLASGQGQIVKLWDYKQRQPLVIYFLAGNEEEFLRGLQSEYAAYRQMQAEMLVITALDANAVQQLTVQFGLSYHLLADADRAAHNRFIKLTYPDYDSAKITNQPVAVFVADRFGAISRYQTALSVDKLPPQSEILEWLEFLGNLCNP